MRRSSKKLPEDSNQRAAEIVRMSTEDLEQPKATSAKSLISQYLSEIGKKGGLKGGKARAKMLSSRKRKEIAKKAALTRWKRNLIH